MMKNWFSNNKEATPTKLPAAMSETSGDSEELGVTDELSRILEVFPDVDCGFALDWLEHVDNDVEQVLERLVDMNGSYPNQAAKQPATITPVAIQPKKPSSMDYMSPTGDAPSHRYVFQSTERLTDDFPFLDKRKARALLESSFNRYTIVHDKVCQTILGNGETVAASDDDNERQYDELLLTLLFDKGALTADEVDLLAGIFKVKGPKQLVIMPFFRRKRRHPRITSTKLQEEIQYVKEKLAQLKRTLELEIDRRRLRRASILAGTAMVCACCYDEVAMEEMVACRDEGHLFCQECLSSYVEAQVFANGSFGVNPETKESALEVLCCHGDGCTSRFDRYYLKKALKPKVLEKHDALQFQATIEKAGLGDDMFSCPKCELTFEIPPEANFFVCATGCGYEICRHCGEPPHIPLRCDEIEKKREGKGRMRVEEAATAVVVRCCPKCKQGIIKADGCNRIKCACGCRFCYCCREKIASYDHFCQVPHCTHTFPYVCQPKCPLYTDDLESEDREAMTKAAMAEAAKVQAESNNEDTKAWAFGRADPGSAVKVDVESILRRPTDNPTVPSNMYDLVRAYRGNADHR